MGFHSPDADSRAVEFFRRLEGTLAAGVVEVDANDSANLSSGLNEIRLVLLFQAPTGEAMAIADLSHQGREKDGSVAEGEIGFVVRHLISAYLAAS